MQRPYQIGVAGGGASGGRAYAAAEQVGRGIAEGGAVLLCGGLGGIMEAAARGARDAGGSSIGIIPGIDPEEANPYISHVICTGMGQARNVVFVQSTEALIAVDGSYGTLSEIAVALKQRIPVVALESWPNAQIDGDELFTRAEGPADAVSRALAYAKERRSGRPR